MVFLPRKMLYMMEGFAMRENYPVNERRINENVTRLNAFVTFLIVSVFMFTPARWILFLLPADFALRAWFRGRFSPVAKMNRFLVSSFHLGESLIEEEPKIFASYMGLILSGFAVAGQFYNLPALTYGMCVMLLLGSFLEAAYGICMGCRIYPMLHRKKLQ